MIPGTGVQRPQRLKASYFLSSYAEGPLHSLPVRGHQGLGEAHVALTTWHIKWDKDSKLLTVHDPKEALHK